VGLPGTLLKTFDALRSVGVASDALSLGTAGVMVAGGAVATPVLALGAALIAGLAGYDIYRRWQGDTQLNKLEIWLEQLATRQGGLLAGLEHVLMHEPDLLRALPPEARGQPLRVFHELLKASEDRQAEILAKSSGALLAFSVECTRRIDEIDRALATTSADVGALYNFVRRVDVTLDERLAAAIAPRPWLVPGVLPQQAVTRFKAGAMRTGVYSREREQGLLNDFLATQAPFAWQLVTGPGGMGKSRLALDLGLRHQDTWDFGFLRELPPEALWRDWRPIAPTFIILDYLLGKIDKIAGAIASMQAAAAQYGSPVRVLLLERDAKGDWWKRASASHAGQYVTDLDLSRYQEPIVLTSLDPAGVAEVYQDVLRSSKKETTDQKSAQFADAFLAIDPNGRPLYAAMAAEAVMEKGLSAIRSWRAQDLTEYVLRRERSRWSAIIPDEVLRWKFENLLALVTLARGLDVKNWEVFDDPSIRELVPTRAEYGDGERYAAMAGRAVTPGDLAPLEPDLLGELFVLERLHALR